MNEEKSALIAVDVRELTNTAAVEVRVEDPALGKPVEIGHLSDSFENLVTPTRDLVISLGRAERGLSSDVAKKRMRHEGLATVSTSFNAPCAVAYYSRRIVSDGRDTVEGWGFWLKPEDKPIRQFFFDADDEEAEWRLATAEEIERCFEGRGLPGRVAGGAFACG